MAGFAMNGTRPQSAPPTCVREAVVDTCQIHRRCRVIAASACISREYAGELLHPIHWSTPERAVVDAAATPARSRPPCGAPIALARTEENECLYAEPTLTQLIWLRSWA
jgi:hypothetical protein